MALGNPTVTVYGVSTGERNGQNLTDWTPSGHIITTNLNTGTLQDTVEFNEFEHTVYSFVMARLGHPTVRVELTPFQIKSCIDEAVSQLSYHAPLWARQFAIFDASMGINAYRIPQYILENLTYVVYKKTLLSIQQQSGTIEFDFFLKYFQDNHLFDSFHIGDFYLLQQNLEMVRKILGQEGSWDVIDGKWLQLYPIPTQTPERVILEFRAISSDSIHSFYRLWIQKYTMACAKCVLGEIRGKYASIPGPGGTTQLNGERMYTEGMKEKDDLEDDLNAEIEEPPTFTCF